jgi:hypothetical protein
VVADVPHVLFAVLLLYLLPCRDHDPVVGQAVPLEPYCLLELLHCLPVFYSRDIAQKQTLFELMVLNGIPYPQAQRGIGHFGCCSKLEGDQLHVVFEQAGDLVLVGGDDMAEDVLVDGSKRKLEVGDECS